MCLCSETELTRNARMGEQLTIGHHRGHYYQGNVFKGANVGGREIACIKTGHRVEFQNLPRKMQLQHLIPETAVATFRTNYSDVAQTRTDQFEFDNGRVVIALNDMPVGTKLTYRGKVRTEPAQPERTAAEPAAVTREPELVTTARANLGAQTMTFTVRGENPMGQRSATRRTARVPAALIRAGQGVANHAVSSVGMLIAAIGIAALLH